MKRMNDEFGFLPEEEYIPREPVQTAASEYAIPEPEFTRLRDEYEYAGEKASEKERSGISNTATERKRHRSMLLMLAGSAAAVVLASTAPARGEASRIQNYDFRTAGEAICLNESIVELVADDRQTWGAVWSLDPIDLSRDSYITFDYLMTAHPEFSWETADGFTLAFAETPIKDDGPLGGELGYRGTAAVEFDLCVNFPDEGFDEKELGTEHIGILHEDAMHHYESAAALAPMEDGQWHRAAVSVSDGEITVNIDGSFAISAYVEDINKPLYIGFTGANGDGTCYDLVAHAAIDGIPITFSGKEAEPQELEIMAPIFEKYEDYRTRGRIPAAAMHYTSDEDWIMEEEELILPELQSKVLDHWEDCPDCEEGRVPCKKCNGKGMIHHDKTNCGTCGGSGSIKTTFPVEYVCRSCGNSFPTMMPDCPACAAVDPLDKMGGGVEWNPCLTCGGSGVGKNAWDETCKECEKGTISCKTCEGTGQVFVKGDEL